MTEFRAEMEDGADQAEPKLQLLMDRRSGFVADFTGGAPGIEKSLTSFYENDTSMPTGEQIDRELIAYAGKAMAARTEQARTGDGFLRCRVAVT